MFNHKGKKDSENMFCMSDMVRCNMQKNQLTGMKLKLDLYISTIEVYGN